MTMPDTGDIVDVLLEQHEVVKHLFIKVQGAWGDDKKKFFDELVEMLETHEKGEQETIHVAMRDTVTDGDAIAEARVEEEKHAEQALAELTAIGVEHPDFEGKFESFHKAVLDHATHEEEDEFPRLRQWVTAERLHMMADELRSIQALH
jgi:hypothetical protein